MRWLALVLVGLAGAAPAAAETLFSEIFPAFDTSFMQWGSVQNPDLTIEWDGKSRRMDAQFSGSMKLTHTGVGALGVNSICIPVMPSTTYEIAGSTHVPDLLTTSADIGVRYFAQPGCSGQQTFAGPFDTEEQAGDWVDLHGLFTTAPDSQGLEIRLEIFPLTQDTAVAHYDEIVVAAPEPGAPLAGSSSLVILLALRRFRRSWPRDGPRRLA